MTTPRNPGSAPSTRRGPGGVDPLDPAGVDPLGPGSVDPLRPAPVDPLGSGISSAPPLGTDPNASSGVQDKARDVAGQAQDKAQEVAGQARSRLTDQVDQRSTQAGQQVAGSAGDMRSVAQELRNQGKDRPARIAEQVADRGERLGGYLESSDAERILQDVEDFGRRQPWVVMVGGLGLGLVASRFLKASSRRRYETYSSPYRPTTRPLPRETMYTGAATAPGAPYTAGVGEPPYSPEPLPPRATSEPPLGDRPADDPGWQGTAGTR